MIRFFILITMVSLTLIAANPKIFSGAGDPLFNDMEATERISRLYAFKTEKAMLEDFINRVEATKKNGFELQKRKDQAGAKAYLNNLRSLSNENQKIRQIIKAKLQDAMQTNFRKRYQQIIATRHALFREDPYLRKEIARYEQKLAQQKKAEAVKYQQYLRSPAHFKGRWDNETMQWDFTESTLTISKSVDHKFQQFKGEWKLEKPHLVHHVFEASNQHNAGPVHTRRTDTTQYFELINITAKTLKVRDIYGEIITLTKR